MLHILFCSTPVAPLEAVLMRIANNALFQLARIGKVQYEHKKTATTSQDILYFMHNLVHINTAVVSSFLVITITTLKKKYTCMSTMVMNNNY